MKETEIKLKVPDVSSLVSKLTGMSFAVSGDRNFEDNWVFDYPDFRLGNGLMLLRLRQVGGRTILTFKGPSEGDRQYKIREEIECTVSDASSIRAILLALGLREVFRYQKWRTEYRFSGQPEGHVLLDETPIGDYVELEGPPDWIDLTAQSLGYSARDYILKSYWALYLEDCAQKRVRPALMLFKPAEREE
ncbi:MAG: class IV adenylate cyclase [Acidobacteriia bacterium]|nr:class IV adenylate cyclase [Terriglobia bacterium]